MRFLPRLCLGLAVLPVLPLPAAAQGSPFRQAAQCFVDAQGHLDYWTPVQRLKATRSQYDPRAFAQALSTYYSFIGVADSTLPSRPNQRPPAAAGNQLRVAAPVLLERAARTSVVLINEAHDQPAHRAYCRELLRQLRPLGYQILAVEALEPADSAINERGFPLAQSGFYIREPNMGKLLRAARHEGYYLFGHELRASQEKEIGDWRRRSNYRDSVQALNLLAVLRRRPGTKLVALVGYDHILERERDGLKRVATYLRELGHLDPLTIDQTQAYPALAGTSWPPQLLAGTDGAPTTVGDNAGYVDLQLIYPRSRPTTDRPAWVFATPTDAPVRQRIPAPYAGHPCLVQLYDRREYRRYGTQAIPLDQYLTTAQQQYTQLAGLAGSPAIIVTYRPVDDAR